MFFKILFSKNKFNIFFWSAVNAMLMLWVTFFMLRIPYVLPDEFMLVQATSVTKNLLLGLEEKPDTNRFLFVNVAWDKVMSNRYDPDFPGYVVGKEPITDRAKLVGLLKLLEKNPNHEFIVLDIFFKGTTEYDDELVRLINKIPRLLVSYHRDQNDKPDLPDLAIKPLGLSDIETVDDKCLKFKVLHNDSLKSTPLLMYEKLHDQNFFKGAWFYYLGKHPVLNSFILDYRIRNYDYSQKRYASVNLGEWINIAYRIPQEIDLDMLDFGDESFEEEGFTEEEGDPTDEVDIDAMLEDSVITEEFDEDNLEEFSTDSTEEFNDELFFADEEENIAGIYDLEYLDEETANELIYPLTKDRIIFIGDFEDRDIHETIYGNTPGPIILLDAFLALEYGDNLLKPYFSYSIDFIIYFYFLRYLLISLYLWRLDSKINSPYTSYFLRVTYHLFDLFWSYFYHFIFSI